MNDSITGVAIMNKYEIVPLVLSNITVEKSNMMYLTGCGIKVTLPVVSFYIRGASQNILIDTGASAEFIRRYDPNQPVENVQSLVEALAKQGLKPEDIDIIIQTHLHHDHIGNTAKCTNAKVIVQDSELSFALNPHPLFAGLYPQEVIREITFEPVKGDIEVADGIRLILTPGHSPGTQSVAVETANGTAIITGFCCIGETFNVSLETQRVLPAWQVYAPGCHTDALAAFDNALKVKKLAKILIPNHEPTLRDTKTIP
ncbi:N-acyl homoserine lactonase family protein [Chloroflexota bacterium]